MLYYIPKKEILNLYKMEIKLYKISKKGNSVILARIRRLIWAKFNAGQN